MFAALVTADTRSTSVEPQVGHLTVGFGAVWSAIILLSVCPQEGQVLSSAGYIEPHFVQRLVGNARFIGADVVDIFCGVACNGYPQ